MHWLLFYDYVDDILERRGPFRDAHLAHARDAHDRGRLLVAGAMTDPVDGAVFVFGGDDPSVIEEFVGGDPYVTGGLVKSWRIRVWTVVTGTERLT